LSWHREDNVFLFQFAANYARDNLIKNLNNKVVELKNLIATGNRPKPTSGDSVRKDVEKKPDTAVGKKNSFRKTMSTSQTDECMKKGASVTDPELLSRLDTLSRHITREVRPMRQDTVPRRSVPTASYLDASGNINYRHLLTDEVLAADHLLVEAAKKSMDVAGTCLVCHIMQQCVRCQMK
jgi:protein phosphatase 1L